MKEKKQPHAHRITCLMIVGIPHFQATQQQKCSSCKVILTSKYNNNNQDRKFMFKHKLSIPSQNLCQMVVVKW